MLDTIIAEWEKMHNQLTYQDWIQTVKESTDAAPSRKFFHRQNSQAIELKNLSRAVNHARKCGEDAMARAILRHRTNLLHRQQIEKVERNKKKNDIRFMVDRYGCLKRLVAIC